MKCNVIINLRFCPFLSQEGLKPVTVWEPHVKLILKCVLVNPRGTEMHSYKPRSSNNNRYRLALKRHASVRWVRYFNSFPPEEHPNESILVEAVVISRLGAVNPDDS